MREYGQIQCSFWSDPDVQNLSDQGKLLFAYLLTGPHSNGLGCYRLPDGYIQADFGWSSETVSKGLHELFSKGFVNRCSGSFFVVIFGYLKWNPISNGNVALARMKEFSTVPKKSSIYPSIINEILKHGKHFPSDFTNGLETLLEGYGKQDPTLPYPDPDPDPDPILTPSPDGSGNGGASPPPAPAKKPATKKKTGESKGAETWKAYSEAYTARYSTPPVRNAKVSAQITQLVDRLGKDDAPPVAAFYVHHNNSFYVAKGHAVGILLADAEKLRTEWATGKKMTSTQSRQMDRTQANLESHNEALAILESKGHKI